MADDTTPPGATGPTEDKPIWVKDPQTGKVGPVWHPEDIAKAQKHGFVNASQEEANQALYQREAEGWKGKVAAGVAGVAEVVPFARNIVRAVAPTFGEDVDKSAATHPWIHGVGTLAGIAATAGIGAEGTAASTAAAEATSLEKAVPAALEEAITTSKAAGPARAMIGEGEAALAGKAAPQGLEAVLPGGVEKAIIEEGNPHLTREAIRQVEEHLAETSPEIARGVGGAVPSLARRLLGRLPSMASDAKQGALYSGIELTNEKDLGHTPEQVAGHVMSTLFWGATGGVVGGMAMHGIVKAASPLVEAVGERFGKLGDVLAEASAAHTGGGDPAEIVSKARKQIQGGLDAIDRMGNEKFIDRGMEAARKKVGDAGMKDLDAARIKAEDAYEAAGVDTRRIFGVKGKLSADRIAKVLKGDERTDALEALQRLHEAGKGLRDFHELLAETGATGLEGVSGPVKKQIDDLLEVQTAMKAGIAKAQEQGTMGQLSEAFGLGAAGEIAGHFGHHLLGSLGPVLAAGKVAKVLWQLAPAEFKAARLAQLSRLSAGVDAHLERVAAAMHSGATGGLVAPAIAGMSFAELKKMRDDVNQKVSNPQLAQDHLEERAGVMQHFAPQAYGQLSMQYGQQLMTLQGILQWPEMQGPFQPGYQPSQVEVRKMAAQIAIVKDPRIAETRIAKGVATPAEVKVYQKAHPARAAQLTQAFMSGMKQESKSNAKLRTLTGAMLLGAVPRSSYSQSVIQGVQGIYATRASQQGGPGSRGGTGGAKALTANQMISLPGQRVANRLPK